MRNVVFIGQEKYRGMQIGVNALAKFTKGKIYVNLDAKDYAGSSLYKLKGVEKT